MAQWEQFERGTMNPTTEAKAVWQYLLLIPEAPVLLALVLIGWAFHFPVGISFLTVLVIALFIIRLLVLSAATWQVERGSADHAQQLADLAVRLHPWSVDARHLQAAAHLLQGDEQQAEDVLRRALPLAPRGHGIHVLLAGTMLEHGQTQEVKSILKATRNNGRLTPHAAVQLAWYTLHVECNPRGARVILRGLHRNRLPPSLAVMSSLTLAETHFVLHDVPAARRALAEALEKLEYCPVPRQAEALYHLGCIEQAFGNDGSDFFRRSVAVDPHGRYAQDAWRKAIGIPFCKAVC